jgi:hypothetical protein
MLTTTRSISPRSKANKPTRYGVTTRPYRWLALILFDFAGHPARHQAPAPGKLNITRTPFDEMNGKIQGFANGHELSVNPVAALPYKITFHEIAHIVLGHTTSEKLVDSEQTARHIREVEAESVALMSRHLLFTPDLVEAGRRAISNGH